MEKKKSAGKARRRKSTGSTKKAQIFKIVRLLFHRYKKYVIAGLAALLLLLIIIFGAKSCGVNHKTPEGVVKSLTESYYNGKQKKILSCYGVKKADENLQKEIDATIKYFEVHNADKFEIDDCGVIYKDKDLSYVYVVYSLILDNEERYPGISTYMTINREEEFYVLPTAEITEEMGEHAAVEYEEFMKSDAYKDYVTAYDTFIKKNPGYEDRIAGKLG